MLRCINLASITSHTHDRDMSVTYHACDAGPREGAAAAARLAVAGARAAGRTTFAHVSWREIILWLLAFVAYVAALAIVWPGGRELDIVMIIVVPLAVIAWRMWRAR